MNLTSFGVCWFAIQVKPRYERLTALCLHQKGYQEFLPIVYDKSSACKIKVERPLYPGYLFCRFDVNVSAPIVTTPGVIRLVGNGARPIPITDAEIEATQILIRSQRSVYPSPFISVGDRVRICEGPLTGASGILVRTKNADRLIVSINLLGRSKAVELEASWAESAKYLHPGSVST